MKIKNILALFLALCMVFALCACGASDGGSDKDADDDQEGQTQDGADATDDTKAQVQQYRVTVVDEDGSPVKGVTVVFTKETGSSNVTTGEDGIAKLTGFVADYVVTVDDVPEDYESDSNEYTFEENSYELTITLEEA